MLVSYWVIICWLLLDYTAEDTFADPLISSGGLKYPLPSKNDRSNRALNANSSLIQLLTILTLAKGLFTGQLPVFKYFQDRIMGVIGQFMKNLVAVQTDRI